MISETQPDGLGHANGGALPLRQKFLTFRASSGAAVAEAIDSVRHLVGINQT